MMRLQSGLVAAVSGLVDEMMFTFGVDRREAQRMLREVLDKQAVISAVRSAIELDFMEDICQKED